MRMEGLTVFFWDMLCWIHPFIVYVMKAKIKEKLKMKELLEKKEKIVEQAKWMDVDLVDNI